MVNSRRAEISGSVADSLRSVYAIFYGRIRIPRISSACADSVYQALPSAYEREPGFEARKLVAKIFFLSVSGM